MCESEKKMQEGCWFGSIEPVVDDDDNIGGNFCYRDDPVLN